MNGVNSTRSFTMPFGSMTALRGALTRNLDIRPLEGIRQPWALFNRDGRRISSVAEFEPMMLLYEGGQWIWPGIEIGHRWYIRNMNADAADLVIETIELLPLIVEIKNFLRLEECDHIISVASPHFFTSKVAHQDKDIGKDSSEWRTSSQWWYDAKFESKPVMPFIQKRVAELTRVPKSHQEHAQVRRAMRCDRNAFRRADMSCVVVGLFVVVCLGVFPPCSWVAPLHSLALVSGISLGLSLAFLAKQILKYEPGQKYVAHHDYFDLRYYATQKDMIAQYDEGGKNRLATVFWYLSTVTNGGHTNFPMAGGLPHPSNFSDCSKGLSVPPEKGKVIIFYSMTPRGELDEYSLHAGCPPAEGELKYSANFWLWNKPVKF